jgi:hypothetical protein
MEQQVERKIFSLSVDVTSQFTKAKPFVFDRNTK